MRVVFMGTPEFALPALRALELSDDVTVVGVFTRPDAASGRGKALLPSPIKLAALAAGLTVYQPQNFRDEAAVEMLRDLAPDLIVVAAYGVILPQAVLDIPPFGCVNIHGSALPAYRGAAPIQRAILDGRETAGVCLMRMEAGLDTGPFCKCATVLTESKPCSQLVSELSELGARLLMDALPALVAGTIEWTAQNDAEATYAQKISKAEVRLSPELDVASNLRRVRASSEQAPARCEICGKSATVVSAVAAAPTSASARFAPAPAPQPAASAPAPQPAAPVPAPQSAPPAPSTGDVPEPGSVVISKRGVFLYCKDGVLQLESLKPDGKKTMDARAWALGLRDAPQNWRSLS